MTVLKLWAGLVVVCVATALPALGDGETEPASAVDYGGAVLIQLGVADLDGAIRFYTEVMGFALERRDDRLQWARIKPGIADVTIGLGVREEVSPGEAISLNFSVTDIDVARRQLEARGVVFDGPTIEVPGVVRLADLRDPDGHRIRLAEDTTGDRPESE